MKAMILAAGLGTRLRPLTDSLPKALLPVAGTPIIVWNLGLLRRHGITDVVINLHHLGARIEQHLGDGARFGMRVSYSHEPVILGTGGGIKQVESFFEGDSFLVLNGDTILDVDLDAVARFHLAREALATMVVRADPDPDRWGAVELDERQRVVRITGRGRKDVTRANKRMFAGVHVMHPRLLASVPPGRESSIIDAYAREIERGAAIAGFEMTGYWSDVGTPERYAQVQRDAEAGLIRPDGGEASAKI
jgi:NDP-sugar pyrophosphorylase family protein